MLVLTAKFVIVRVLTLPVGTAKVVGVVRPVESKVKLPPPGVPNVALTGNALAPLLAPATTMLFAIEMAVPLSLSLVPLAIVSVLRPIGPLVIVVPLVELAPKTSVPALSAVAPV